MRIEQMTLQDQVALALKKADAAGDCLIAALLSQCLDIIDTRVPDLSDPLTAAH